MAHHPGNDAGGFAMEQWDHIIVGGGSAGSVLANRLSADPSRRVLLIEAGEDTPPGKVPPEVLDSFPGKAYLNPRFLWSELRVTTEAMSHNRPGERPRLRRYEQARVLGGGSAINGQLANRGLPEDYAEWEERGAQGWGWADVLPFFRRVEADQDFGGELHGTDGPIGVRRVFQDQWAEHARVYSEVLSRTGLPYLPDQNGCFEDGHFPVPISNVNDQRVTAAMGYLTAEVRARPNLRLLTGTQVTSLAFTGRRCTGVTTTAGDFAAREVILSSGAIHSPAHLLRAGIGPAAQLRNLGIPVLLDAPGVGQRLMDHPSIAVASFIPPHARINGRSARHIFLVLRFSSGVPGAPGGDMGATLSSKSAWHAVGDQIGTMNMWVNKTFSEAGTVTLSTSDWRAHPDVDFNLLSDRRDLERLMVSFRRFAALHALPELQAVASDAFAASYSDKVRAVADMTVKNRLTTAILAKLLDGPAALRRKLIDSLIVEGDSLPTLMQDDDALEAFVRKAAVGVWHASCTCRMGAEDDPMAVTDTQGRVRGVEGLRVCDASIFPVVPRANTNFPVMMAAEKVAAAMLEGSK